MLSSAVERASKVAPAKKTRLEKQLFPSSSPTPIEDAFKATAQSSQLLTQHSRRGGLTASNTLKPSAQSILNGVGTTRRIGLSSNGLKRMASQLDGIPCNPINSDEKPPPLIYSVASTYNSSISRLHEGVYFDENDFDDDIDLDFDSPPGKATISQLVPQPILPTNGVDKTKVPDSSAPLPWSSSPLEHRLPPQQEAGGNGNLSTVVISSTAGGNSQSQASRRRTLPWLDGDAADEQQEVERNTLGLTSRGAAAGRRSKRIKSDGHDPLIARFTPLPRNNTNSNPHPWNKTASDVKEEQKRLRQTNKRLVKTNEATEEDKAKAIEEKKKRTVIKVFLSDEQRHVEQLVVEKGKSVFFTGSAGISFSVG